METKIDISSTMVEKGIDLVKGFVEKIVGSTLEETGLLLGDKVRVYRLKNQIKMLGMTQQICNDNNISIKQISLKTLVPLLEYASLEDEESIQTKWAKLLSNYVDSRKNLESSIFPFILSQLSTKELEILDTMYNSPLIGSRFDRLQIDGVIKSNLIRLGLAEIIIPPPKNENSLSLRIQRGFGINYKIKLTPLGNEFYKCCSTD
ncbi:MAG: DUF4393 domain-containing protein [Flavobacterium sp. JAD_PAG50586_2]|nr:MAG: DUF4393 domain-containing protein [Flavobacterium sp. JAD_PAG50586_2]